MVDPTSTIDAQAVARVLTDISRDGSISPAAISYVVARLQREGVYSEQHNWGALRCLVTHRHGDGDTCCMVGPIWDRRYVRRYPDDVTGLAELLRVAHHATLSGAVDDLPEASTLAGYRSTAANNRAPDPDPPRADEADRLDGLFDGLQDKAIRSGVLSFCRGVLSDEEKAQRAAAKVDGVIDDAKDWLVRGAVVSFCRGQVKAAESADSVSGFFGPSAEAQRKVEEVAAQWAALKPRMDKDPRIARELRPQYEYWLGFWAKWQAGNQDEADVRAVIADVNTARANADKVFTQDDKGRVSDVASEKLSDARAVAQKLDDAAREAEEAAKKNRTWKLIAAGAVAALAAMAAVKVAL